MKDEKDEMISRAYHAATAQNPDFNPRESDIGDLIPAMQKLLPGGWILTRSATPSIALLHRQIHRQKSVPVSNPQLPPDFEGKQSAWQEGISSRFNEVGRCTSRQNSGTTTSAASSSG